MNRLLVGILLLTTLLLTTMPAQTVATNAPLLQDFDREACYSNCPCDIPGIEQACAAAHRNVTTSSGRILTTALGIKKGTDWSPEIITTVYLLIRDLTSLGLEVLSRHGKCAY